MHIRLEPLMPGGYCTEIKDLDGKKYILVQVVLRMFFHDDEEALIAFQRNLTQEEFDHIESYDCWYRKCQNDGCNCNLKQGWVNIYDVPKMMSFLQIDVEIIVKFCTIMVDCTGLHKNIRSDFAKMRREWEKGGGEYELAKKLPKAAHHAD